VEKDVKMMPTGMQRIHQKSRQQEKLAAEVVMVSVAMVGITIANTPVTGA
jgi:hypothetical protein